MAATQVVVKVFTVSGAVPVCVALVKLPPSVKPEPSAGPPWIFVTTNNVATTEGVGTVVTVPFKVWLTLVVDAIVPDTTLPDTGVEK